MRKLLCIFFVLSSSTLLRAQFTISISSLSDTACNGAPVVVTATGTGISTPHYQWQVNGSNTGTDTSVFVTDTLSNGASVCCQLTSSGGIPLSTSNSIVFTILPPPYAGIITGPDSVCFQSSITLSDTTAGGTWATALGYATVSGGLVTAESIMQYECGQLPTWDTIFYMKSNYCGTDTAVKLVLIEVLPSAWFYLGSNPTTWTNSMCVGEQVLVNGGDCPWGSILSTNGNVGVSWYLYGLHAGSDILVSIDSNYCGVSRYSLPVVVYGVPTVNPIVASATELCGGSTIVLSDSADTYYSHWYCSNLTASLGVYNGLTITVTGVYAGIDTIFFQTSNMCGVARTSIAVTVDAPAAIGTPTPVCAGGTELITDISPGGTWSSKNTLIATIDPVTGLLTGQSPGKDTITYMLANGCFVTTTVSVMPSPSPIAVPAYICVDSLVFLSDTGSGIWRSDNDSIAFIEPSTNKLICRHAGVVAISYTLPDGCFDTAIATVVNCDTNTNSTLKTVIFPNPSIEHVTIQTSDTTYSGYSFTNTIGQVSLRGKVNGMFTSISIRSLPPGVYFITLYGNNDKYVCRFLKK